MVKKSKTTFHCKSEAQKKAIAHSYARLAKNKSADVRDIAYDEARLAKITNKYLFDSENPMGEHTYVIYKDTSTHEIRAIPCTHLYVPDKKNTEKLNKGLLRKVKFAGYETPSGINNYYISKDVNGKNLSIDLQYVKIDKTPIPYKQAQIIIGFAKYERKK